MSAAQVVEAPSEPSEKTISRAIGEELRRVRVRGAGEVFRAVLAGGGRGGGAGQVTHEGGVSPGRTNPFW
jgi:hypothetical protein